MTRLIALGLVVLLGGCATEDESVNEPGGSSIQDMLARSHAEKRERGLGPERGGGGEDLPPGWRDRMDGWWDLWVRSDPGWEDARTQWVALGPEAEGILVENLIRWYTLGYEATQRYEVNRARRELQLFPTRSIDYLVAGIGAAMGDGVTRSRCEDLLASFGRPAVPAIEEAFDDASDEGRFALTRTLRKIGDPAAIPFLMDVADGRDDFKVRIEAIKALGELEASEATPVLREGLRDGDPSVRKFSAHYLAAVHPEASPEILDALVGCMESAEQDGDFELASTCRKSLTRLYGEDMGRRARDWRRVISRRD
jgi:hypothetical protein